MQPNQTKRFDGWVFRADSGELSKGEQKLRLQDQPRQILDELLLRPGEVVTREQLIARLWPKGVVDFDTGLNSAVRKLRVALADDADTPRYIETIPRRGYRFIGVLEPIIERGRSPGPPLQNSISDESLDPSAPVNVHTARPPPGAGRRRHIYVSGALLGAALLAAALWLTARKDGAQPLEQSAANPAGPASLDAHTLAVVPFTTPSGDEPGALLAASVTDLVRTRLAANPSLTVISGASSSEPGQDGLDPRALARSLGAGRVLTGDVERTGDRLRLEVRLMDAAGGERPLWAETFERNVADLGSVRETVHAHVAAVLNVSPASDASRTPVIASVNLDAYELYIRGQRLMENRRLADAELAYDLFRRATILEPSFARGHLAMGQALNLAHALKGQPPPKNAIASNDRALELNPFLGEAWIERARGEPDQAQAEALYRKGIALAPSYSMGYLRYAEFVWDQGRTGEAIELVSRALRLDPRNTRAHQRLAFLVMVQSSDVARHDALHREALAINPQLASSMQALLHSAWEFQGQFAAAAQIAERTIAMDPADPWHRHLASSVYLEMDDVDAAVHVLGDAPFPASEMVLAQYRGDHRRAGDIALQMESLWSTGPVAPGAEAVRDAALLSGAYEPALKKLEGAYAIGSRAPMTVRGLALVYAHTLMLAGERERGRKLAAATLVMIDTHSVGRPADWFARERASAYVLLGDHERALKELADDARSRRTYRWWYLVDHDPLFAPLRADLRFQAIAEQAKQHSREQRMKLEEMRRRGNIVVRP